MKTVSPCAYGVQNLRAKHRECRGKKPKKTIPGMQRKHYSAVNKHTVGRLAVSPNVVRQRSIRAKAASPRFQSLATCSTILEDGQTVLRDVTSSKLYRVYLQGSVVIVISALIDAAYSGDWSRIGAITIETEERLKGYVIALGYFHLLMGPSAAAVAAYRGKPVLPAFAKTMLVGGLSFFETCFSDVKDADEA